MNMCAHDFLDFSEPTYEQAYAYQNELEEKSCDELSKHGAIWQAAEMAITNDTVMVVGKIKGAWTVAHSEDVCKINQMTDVLQVDASGVYEF